MGVGSEYPSGFLHGKELGHLQDQESGPPSELGMHMVGRAGENQSIVFISCSKESETPEYQSLSLKIFYFIQN